MKRIIFLVVFLLVLAVGLSFALMNAETVMLSYYFGTISAPLSIVVVVSLAAGTLLGVLACMGMALGLKQEISRLRRSVKVTEKEVENLRSLPLKDEH
ncbi:MAG: LapA family protein [Gammaproteobacteria bacterium]|nr:LapA family protein [Gammaproteobacteria bacterium]MCF6364174.1 LapA family protein [Gammaproteobacteria bacterium]